MGGGGYNNYSLLMIAPRGQRFGVGKIRNPRVRGAATDGYNPFVIILFVCNYFVIEMENPILEDGPHI